MQVFKFNTEKETSTVDQGAIRRAKQSIKLDKTRNNERFHKLKTFATLSLLCFHCFALTNCPWFSEEEKLFEKNIFH